VAGLKTLPTLLDSPENLFPFTKCCIVFMVLLNK
jgi:hypothetical protein